MYCPDCHGQLVSEELGGTSTCRCPACRYLWLEPGTVQPYLQARFPTCRHPLPADDDFADGVLGSSGKPMKACPGCTGTTLLPGRLRHLTEVRYHRCNSCNGILIDEGLLVRVVRVPGSAIPQWLAGIFIAAICLGVIFLGEFLMAGLEALLEALFGEADWIAFAVLVLIGIAVAWRFNLFRGRGSEER